MEFRIFICRKTRQFGREMLMDIVHFSFPEVVETPENRTWFKSMSDVMDRLGYQIFDVKKYCPKPPQDKTLISSSKL